jgi:hypothetical protein
VPVFLTCESQADWNIELDANLYNLSRDGFEGEIYMDVRSET